MRVIEYERSVLEYVVTFAQANENRSHKNVTRLTQLLLMKNNSSTRKVGLINHATFFLATCVLSRTCPADPRSSSSALRQIVSEVEAAHCSDPVPQIRSSYRSV